MISRDKQYDDETVAFANLSSNNKDKDKKGGCVRNVSWKNTVQLLLQRNNTE